MSTILKALEKARRERSQQDDSKVATLFDVPTPAVVTPKAVVQRRSRVGLVITSIVISSLITLSLVVGAILFLQQRLQQWTQSLQSASPAAPSMALAPTTVAVSAAQGGPAPSVAAGGITPPQQAAVAAPNPPSRLDRSAAVDLPTPVPMHELLNPVSPTSVNLAEREVLPPAGRTSAPGLRTSPVSASSDDTQGFVLGPILYDPQSPMAIVNGLSVRKGGVYENFRVLDITPDSVTVQRPGGSPVVLRKRP